MSFTAVLHGLLGFMAGWLVGNFWGTGRREPAPTKASPRRTNDAKPKRWSKEQWVGPVVLLLAVLMGVQYMVQVNRERDYTACQTAWNTSFAKQLSIRSELASQAQANVDQIILSIGKLVLPEDATPTPAEQRARAAEYRKLFQDFATESAVISKRRAATPLPKLPDCGGEAAGVPATLAAEQDRIEALEAELDASRAAILAAKASEPAVEEKPAQSAQVRTVVVREPAKPTTAEPPAVLQPPIVVTLPAPVAPKPVVAEVAQPAERVCVLNLLGICVDL